MSRTLNSLVGVAACLLAAFSVYHNRYDVATFWAVWMVESAITRVVYAVEDTQI